MAAAARRSDLHERRRPRGVPGRRALWAAALAFAGGFAAGGGTAWALRSAGGAPGSAGAPAAQDLARFAGHMDAAARSFAAARYPQAFESLRKAAAIHPRDPAPHHGLGEVYEKLAMREAAAASFRRAHDADPSYWPAVESLIKALYDLGRHDEALEVIRKAEATRPQEPFLWAEKALNLLRNGKAREAVPLLERYNRAAGRQAWGYAHLARAQAEAGDAEAAERAYREAIALDAKLASAHFWLAQLLIQSGRRQEAEGFLATYRRLRGLETQLQQVEIVLQGRPDDVGLLVALARARLELGRGEPALAALRRALDVAPGDEKLRRLYAEVRAQVERPPAAR